MIGTERYVQEIKGTWTKASLKWGVLVQNLKQVLIVNTKHAVKGGVIERMRGGCLCQEKAMHSRRDPRLI